jgi:predicted Zn-dependent protease
MTPPLSLEQAREIFATLLRCSDADETEATIGAAANTLTRFANNAIHQNVADCGHSVSVRVTYDGRTARATTNKRDEPALRAVVAEAAALARGRQPDPHLLAMPGPQEYPAVSRHFAATAAASPEDRAARVRTIVAAAEREKLTAAGVVATGESCHALLNSRGLAAFYHDTHAEVSLTMMGPDSSGWAKANSPDLARIDVRAMAETAVHKAAGSSGPIELPPGRYTVILEPAAVLDLLGFMFYDFSGLALIDQRSFLTGRMGQKLFGENITITDDVTHPLQTGAPFDGEGLPRRTIPLVERGVVRNVVYARATARQAGAEPTGHGFPLPNEFGEAPVNIVMDGGAESVEQMIASTEWGILVTRLWYIREVDPYEKIMTGMTRDGTFLVENGKVARGIRNMRFNQSLIELLNHVQALGPAVRSAGEESFEMVVPAMKVSDFHFSEVTRF